MPVGARCPECGVPIHDVDSWRDAPLAVADLSVIGRVQAAVLLLGVAIVGAIVVSFAGVVGVGLPIAPGWCWVALALTWATGAWLLTAPHRDPSADFHGFGPRDQWRRVARLGAFAPLALALANAGVWMHAIHTQPGPVGVLPPDVTSLDPRWRAPLVGTPGGSLPSEEVLVVLAVTAAASVILVLVMLERLGRWSRDGFAEPLALAGQWVLPLALIGLLTGGFGVPGSYLGTRERLGGAILLVGLLPVLVTVGSLVLTVARCRRHRLDYLERMARRAHRAATFSDDVARQVERMHATEVAASSPSARMPGSPPIR